MFAGGFPVRGLVALHVFTFEGLSHETTWMKHQDLVFHISYSSVCCLLTVFAISTPNRRNTTYVTMAKLLWKLNRTKLRNCWSYSARITGPAKVRFSEWVKIIDLMYCIVSTRTVLVLWLALKWQELCREGWSYLETLNFDLNWLSIYSQIKLALRLTFTSKITEKLGVLPIYTHTHTHTYTHTPTHRYLHRHIHTPTYARTRLLIRHTMSYVKTSLDAGIFLWAHFVQCFLRPVGRWRIIR